jgi:hypothetical protein
MAKAPAPAAAVKYPQIQDDPALKALGAALVEVKQLKISRQKNGARITISGNHKQLKLRENKDGKPVDLGKAAKYFGVTAVAAA